MGTDPCNQSSVGNECSPRAHDTRPVISSLNGPAIKRTKIYNNERARGAPNLLLIKIYLVQRWPRPRRKYIGSNIFTRNYNMPPVASRSGLAVWVLGSRLQISGLRQFVSVILSSLQLSADCLVNRRTNKHNHLRWCFGRRTRIYLINMSQSHYLPGSRFYLPELLMIFGTINVGMSDLGSGKKSPGGIQQCIAIFRSSSSIDVTVFGRRQQRIRSRNAEWNRERKKRFSH